MSIWKPLVSSEKATNFFGSEPLLWLEKNLEGGFNLNGGEQNLTLFAMVMWWHGGGETGRSLKEKIPIGIGNNIIFCCNKPKKSSVCGI